MVASDRAGGRAIPVENGGGAYQVGWLNKFINALGVTSRSILGTSTSSRRLIFKVTLDIADE